MDPNVALVFETIGQIEKSLQCSICLDLLNDAHSTRCNHQFCSHCIRKVVDERKDKKQEALCPLCKNPITKRSLTSNPRLNKIVDIVRKLNKAAHEDAGIPLPESPYSLVNSKLNGRSSLQSSRLNPTPLKPVMSPKSNGLRREEQLDCVNHLHSISTSRRSRKKTSLDESLSPREVVSQEKRKKPFEILSLLESEEYSQTEQPTTYIGEEDEQNDRNLPENCGGTNLATARRSSPFTLHPTKDSVENVNTDNTKSSGSLTIDVEKSTQSGSIASDNSVSIMRGLSQQSSDKAIAHKKSLNDKHNSEGTPDDDMNKSKPSPLSVNKRNEVDTTKRKKSKWKQKRRNKSQQSSASSNSIKRTPDQYSSERVPASVDSDSQAYNVIPMPRYHSDDVISPEFPRPTFRRENDNCDNNQTAGKISSDSKLCLFSEEEDPRGNLIQTERYKAGPAENFLTSEVCGDSEALLVLQSKSKSSFRRQKCKRKQSKGDTNRGSPEFSSPCSCPALSETKTKISSNENTRSSVAERISSQDELCLPADFMGSQQTKNGSSAKSIPSSQNSKNSEASIISPSQSGCSFGNRKFKRKRSAEDNNSLNKFSRLNGDTGMSKISVESRRETDEYGLDKCGPKKIESNHASTTSQEARKKSSNNLHTKIDVSEVNGQQNLSVHRTLKANKSDDNEDDIIPPTPPDVGCFPCKKGSAMQVKSLAVSGHVYADDDGDNDDEMLRGRSKKLEKIRKRRSETELVHKGDCFDEDYDDKETSRPQTNKTSGRISACKSSSSDNVFIHDECDDEEELMNVKSEGSSQMYSSQEDLNVALLRRLAPVSSSHKGSDRETESDGEASDCKNNDTTSVSSLTDVDGVEVSSQRIKYLHAVLAQTGGEIEKLTTDLKNLRKSEVNVQPNELRDNHSNFTENSCGLKMEKDNEDIDTDSSSDREEKNVFGYDKESDARDCREDSSLEKENENGETWDGECNIRKKEGVIDCNDKANVTSKNEDCKYSFGVLYDLSSDNDQAESESAKEDGVTEKDHISETDCNYESDFGVHNDDVVEIVERGSLSPPPTLDHSSVKLTKLPPAIKKLKKMLHQDGDSEEALCGDGRGNEVQEEENDTNYDNSSQDHFQKTLTELKKLFGNKHTSRIPDMHEDANDESYDPNTALPRSLHRTDKRKDNQLKKTESRKENSRKENSVELKRSSVSRNEPHENCKRGNSVKKIGESSCVLKEVRTNAAPKQRTLVSILENNLNHSNKKTIQTSKPSPCFVTTRLPKQFVSLAGYLAERIGGKISDDVSEETTHIIMPTDSEMQASRKNYTIKYLLGIALGKWIVSQQWISACVKAGRLIDEKQYEVKGDEDAAQSHVPNVARSSYENKGPSLFDGISVVCFGKFNDAMSRVQLCQLVRYCGGKVIDFSDELLTGSIYKTSKRLSVMAKGDGRKISDLIIICDSTLSAEAGLQVKDLCKRYRTFPVSAEWITDSVANYQLQDIEEYSMEI